MTDPERSITALSLCLLVVGSMFVPAVALADASAAANAEVITDCQTLSESGTYELEGNLAIDENSERENCIEITASDVTLRGGEDGSTVEFTGEEMGSRGVFVTPGQSNVIVKNIGTTGWLDGVAVGQVGSDPVEDVTLREVNASFNQEGIVIGRSNDVTIQSANTSTNEAGIVATNGGDVTVEDTLAARNSEQAFDIRSEGEVTVTDTTVRDGEGNVEIRAGTGTVTGLTVENNRVFESEIVEFEFTDSGSVSDVLLTDNAARSGLLVQGSANVGLNSITITETGSEITQGLSPDRGGLVIVESSNVAVADATVTDNDMNGISVLGSPQVTISESTVTGNADGGISTISGDELRVLDTVLSQNDFGAVFFASNDVRVEGVEATENLGGGLGFADSSDVVVTGTVVTDTGGTERGTGQGLVFQSTGASVRNTVLRNNAGRDVVSEPGSGEEIPVIPVSPEDETLESAPTSPVQLPSTVEPSMGTLTAASIEGEPRSVASLTTDGASTRAVGSVVQEVDGTEPVVLENVSLGTAPVLTEATLEGAYLEVVTAEGETPGLPVNWVETGNYLLTGSNAEGGYADLSLDAPEDIPNSVTTSSLRVWEFYETWQLFGGSDETASPTAESTVTGSTRLIALLGQEPPEGNFSLGDLSTNSPVRPGETVSVDTTVQNVADRYGTQNVSLRVGDAIVDHTTLTLEPGESRDLTFEWTTSEDDAGDYDLTVASANDTATTTATVDPIDPANYTVDIESTTAPVEAGGSIDVVATVTNTGEVTGEQAVTLQAGDETVDTTTLALEPGESRELTLSWETSTDDAGDHDLTVASANDTDQTTVTVTALERANYAVDIVAADAVVEGGATVDVVANVTNVGDQTGEQVVELRSESQVFDDTTLGLEPGESQEVTLNLRVASGASGQFRLVVASANDTDSTLLRVQGDDSDDSSTPAPTATPTPTPTPSPTATPTPTPTPTDTAAPPDGGDGTATPTPTPTPTPTATPAPTDTVTPVPAETTAPTAAEDAPTDVPGSDDSGLPLWPLLLLLLLAIAAGGYLYVRQRQQ